MVQKLHEKQMEPFRRGWEVRYGIEMEIVLYVTELTSDTINRRKTIAKKNRMEKVTAN